MLKDQSPQIRFIFSSGRMLDSFNKWTLYLFILILPVAAIGYEILNINTIGENILGSIFTILIPLGISLYFFFDFKSRNDLERIKNVNTALIQAVLNDLNWKSIVQNQDFWIIKPGKWHYQISIIFVGNDILIHSIRFGWSDFYTSETTNLKKFIDKLNEIKNAVQHHV